MKINSTAVSDYALTNGIMKEIVNIQGNRIHKTLIRKQAWNLKDIKKINYIMNTQGIRQETYVR